MFDKVVKLDVSHRVSRMDRQQSQFRSLLERLRLGESTEDNWKLLLTRKPSAVENIDDFKDAIRLFFSKTRAAKYNSAKLEDLQQPIARINERHSSKQAEKFHADKFPGLEPCIYLVQRCICHANAQPLGRTGFMQ